jgi:hypothetical protein
MRGPTVARTTLVGLFRYIHQAASEPSTARFALLIRSFVLVRYC